MDFLLGADYSRRLSIVDDAEPSDITNTTTTEPKTMQDMSAVELSEEALDWVKWFWHWLPTLIRPLAVLIIGMLLIRCLTSCLEKWLSRVKVPKISNSKSIEFDDSDAEDSEGSRADSSGSYFSKGQGIDPTILKFFLNFVSVGLKLVLLMAVASLMGIQLMGLAGVFAAAGLGVGLALQNPLADMARGVMLIMFKPFKVGEYITLSNEEQCSGYVTEVGLFNTVIRTTDNAIHIVPNRDVGTLANISNLGTKRIDVPFMISNDEDYLKVKALVLQAAAQEMLCLRQPAPSVLLTSFGAEGVEVTLRAWIKSPSFEDYPPAILERIKLMFDAQRIKIPRNVEVDPPPGDGSPAIGHRTPRYI
jgi:small conductance mechanosensitive channel